MGKYDDIINEKHHVSATHPHMSLHDRAAQFAPFAALTGLAESMEETADSQYLEVLHEVQTDSDFGA